MYAYFDNKRYKHFQLLNILLKYMSMYALVLKINA